MMGMIYPRAKRVLAWTGHDTGAAATVIQGILNFNRNSEAYTRDAQVTVNDPKHKSTAPGDAVDWPKTKDFFDRPFFHCVRIVRELGPGGNALLCNGSYSIERQDLIRLVLVLDNQASFIVNRYKLKTWIVNHTYLAWQQVNDIARHQFPEVLHWVRVHQAADPRDRVFAMLGHPNAKNERALPVQPNYNESYTHLHAYSDVAVNLIVKTKSLRILSLVDHDIEPHSTSLASWVPAWAMENKVMFLGYSSAATLLQLLR